MSEPPNTEAERIIALRARIEKERLQKIAKIEKAADTAARRKAAAKPKEEDE